MRTQLEVFQRLDSRFRGNDKQGGNGEGDAFPWSPYPKLGLLEGLSPQPCHSAALDHGGLSPAPLSETGVSVGEGVIIGIAAAAAIHRHCGALIHRLVCARSRCWRTVRVCCWS